MTAHEWLQFALQLVASLERDLSSSAEPDWELIKVFVAHTELIVNTPVWHGDTLLAFLRCDHRNNYRQRKPQLLA